MHINPLLVNNHAVEVCRVLNHYGYKAYIVGGCVRDLLLGQEPKDWDICTNAPPDEVMKMFEKTYPTGLQHGTVTVAMGEEHFEVTTFRVEGKYTDGRRPEDVKFVTTVEEDLGRRDLTINAIAYEPINKEIVDPYNGIQDLQDKKIRCVGSAIERLTEDGLRIMRVARFAARFGYEVDPRTQKAMTLALPTLEKVSKERIKDELWKTLQTKNPILGLRLLRETGVLELINKEWNNARILGAIEDLEFCLNAEVETKFAVLCSWFSQNTLFNFNKYLKLSNHEFKKITFLLDALDRFANYLPQKNFEYQKRRFLSFIKNYDIKRFEENLEQFLLFSDAIGLEAREESFSIYKEETWARSEMQLNGNDLIAIGFTPGPELKECLDAAYFLIINQPEKNEHETLLTFAKHYYNDLQTIKKEKPSES